MWRIAAVLICMFLTIYARPADTSQKPTESMKMSPFKALTMFLMARYPENLYSPSALWVRIHTGRTPPADLQLFAVEGRYGRFTSGLPARLSTMFPVRAGSIVLESNVSDTNTASSVAAAAPPRKGPTLRKLFDSTHEAFVKVRVHIPNALTIMRVAALPFLVATFYARHGWLQCMPPLLFGLCSFTDWLDGYLARKWAVDSAFGAFLDPVADKLLVCTCLVLLSGALGTVVALPTAIIVCREIAVSALREWMGSKGKSASVKVGYWGKFKTATQMVALQVLLLAHAAPIFGSGIDILLMRDVGLGFLNVAALLTITSAAGYFRAAAPMLLRIDRV